MKSIWKEIEEWNRERGLLDKFDHLNEYAMLEEELDEFIDAKTDDEKADALCDLIVIATGALYKLGYDPVCAMGETIHEIKSRRGSIGPDGKWLKDKSPEAQAKWYKADYNKCR